MALVADFNVRAAKHFKIPDDWTPTSRCALFVIVPRLYWTLPSLQSMEMTITDVSMQRFIYYRSQALLDAPLFTVDGDDYHRRLDAALYLLSIPGFYWTLPCLQSREVRLK